MTTKQDYQHRAAEFLRQWQDQMTRQMNNPDMIRAMLEAMQQFGAPPHDANARRPAHAPDARDDAIRDLTQRLRALEQRVNSLDARVAKAKKPAGASKRASAKDAAPGKRTVGKAKRAVAKPKQPVSQSAKRKPTGKKPAAKRK